MPCRCFAAVFLAAATGEFAVSGSAITGPDLAECTRQFVANPQVADARCFYEVGRRDRVRRAAAIAALERLTREYPDHPWVLFYLGSLRWSQPERASALFLAAADRFAHRGEPEGEVRARYNQVQCLIRLGREAEARQAAEPAIRLAAASDDPQLRARGQVLEAKLLWQAGENLERAEVLLKHAAATLVPAGPYELQKECLSTAGNVNVELWRPQEARLAFQRLADLAQERGDSYAEVHGLYGLLRVRLDEVVEMPGRGGREEVAALARRTSELAAEAGHAAIEAKARWILATLVPSEDAQAEVRRCLEVAPSVRERSLCLTARALGLARRHPDRARRQLDEALELARQADDPWSMAYAWRERMRVSWAVGPVMQAVEDSWSALDAIEVLRDLQSASTSRAEIFTTWSDDYWWLAGHLLEEHLRGGGEELLARAFEVAERSRARALIDALEAAQAAPRAGATTTELQERLAAVLEDIARVQRRLLDPRLTTEKRTNAKAELERLELAESDFRGQIERADPVFADLRRPHFAALGEIQRALAPDQALLSFQVAPSADLRSESASGG